MWIQYNVSSEPNAYLVGGENGIYEQGGYLPVCPSNPYYFPAPLCSFAKMFTKWKPESICFEYVPRADTGNRNALTWGFTQDPVYAETHGWAYSSGDGWHPTEQQIASLPGATQFPVWIPSQCLEVGRIESKWLYGVSHEVPTALTSTDDPSDVRQQYSGALAVAATDNPSGTAGTRQNAGTIFIAGDRKSVV